MFKFLHKLDWEEILNFLNNFIFSEFSKELCQNLLPIFSYPEALKAQEKTKFIWELLEKGEKIELRALKSLKSMFEKASKRGFFLPIELVEIKKWFITLKKLSPYLKISPFVTLLNLYEHTEEIEFGLDKILDWEKAEIKDNASYNLFVLRKKLKETKEILFSKLEKIKEHHYQKGYLQENLFTQREGRYVLPVKVEYKNRIKGILHEISQSGATVFIEPISIVSLSNEIENLRSLEQREVIKILKEISEQIFSFSFLFFQLEDLYAEFEITFAKASLGRTYKGKFPILKKDGSIKIYSGVHPILILKSQEDFSQKIVPNDFIIENGLLISGPNLGGKTVSLKTVGILSLMAQSGFMLPVKEAEIPVFSKIFVDLGDDQDIIKGESSFSSHLKSLKEILEKADENTLVLLDEPGKGTNPEEGTALIAAVMNELLRRGTKITVTTHSQLLKSISLEMKGLKLATMEYDIETREPTYRLVYNVWGESLAFELAKRIGFPETILKEATYYLKNKEYWEGYKILEEEKKKLKKMEEGLILKLKNLEEREKSLQEEKERFKNVYFQKMEELILSWNEEFKKMIEDIKQKKAGYKRAIQNFDNFINKVLESSIKGNLEEDIKEGDRVVVFPLKKEGEVLKVKGDTLEVKLGGFKIEVPKKNVIKDYLKGEYFLTESLKFRQKFKKENLEKNHKKLREKEILKLTGLTVDEALDKIEKALNKAFLEGIQKIYLIHGHGTGKLRKSVREYLSTHPLVKNFKFADPLEGGTGVTIVYLEEKN